MNGELNVMVAFALSRMADGRSPGEAAGDLAAIGVDRRRAAVAVCVACGTSLADAERRMLAYDEIWSLVESDVGALLDSHGYFDLEVVLDEAQNATVSRLQQAIASAGSWPSGSAIAVGRMLRTGRLREAFLFMEDTGAQRWVGNHTFWVDLRRAGEALAPGDVEVVAALSRCAQRSP